MVKKIYLDNAASSQKKPATVLKAMTDYLSNIGCSPGRGGYDCSLKAGRIVLETRLAIAELFNVPSPEQIIFTHNITHALNYAIKGLVKTGEHVITTSMEHNSVIRPLKSLEKEHKIEVSYLKCNRQGLLDPQELEQAIKDNTKIVVLTQASNVTGSLMPIARLASIARQKGLSLILDTAQTAGLYEIDFTELAIDVLCFTGHKSLMGPTGTGGFALTKKTAAQMSPLIEGGTGSISDQEYQPDFLPDKFESGTLNTVGLAGLKAGVEFIRKAGLTKIREHELSLTGRLLAGLEKIRKIQVHGPKDISLQTPTISISVAGFDLGELSYILDQRYGIMTRSGLHCAPLAHKTIGTFPEGTLRFSIGYDNTVAEIDYVLKSLREIIPD